MSPRAVIVLAFAALCGVAFAAPAHADDAVSPGPLAAPHAALQTKCSACHVAFGGVPARQCLTCHTALAKRLAADQGYHASVKAQPCVSCHKEHQGRDAALTPEPPADLNHAITGFPLEGDHAQLACERCHGKAKTSKRWVGLGTRCKSCHADRAHRGALGSACEKCHRARGWSPTRFALADHQLSMAGGHATLSCASCHKAGLRLSGEAQACAQCHRRAHGGTAAPCQTCHRVTGWKQVSFQHAFAPERLPGKHQTAACLACHPAFRFRGTQLRCAACHDRERPHEPMGECDTCHGALSWKDLRFDHAQPRVDFPLLGRHQAARCAGCHPQPGIFRGAPRTCEQCHADPHRGQFALTPAPAPPTPPAAPTPVGTPAPPTAPAAAPAPSAPAAAQTPCARCHTPADWVPSTVTVERHASFGLPLRGAHQRAACKSCHTAGTYVGLPQACRDCHADVRHRGRLGPDCASCHGETAWAPAARFDHRRTGFPLERAHSRATCQACHGADGLRLAATANPTACQTCHVPARHGKQFGERCTECHTATSFRDVPRIDHAARTEFPLELRHATLPCLACHDVRKRLVVNGACRTCHGDPHRASNGFDCLDCHRSDRWRIIRFDHDLTSYPLTGGHRVAGCGGCHTNPNWTGVRTDCVACHAFDRPKTQDHPPELSCDDCHTTASWRTILR